MPSFTQRQWEYVSPAVITPTMEALQAFPIIIPKH